MKRHPVNDWPLPKNDNRPADGAADASNSSDGAVERGDDGGAAEALPTLAEVSSALRDSAHELLEMVENLLTSPNPTDHDTPPRFDELLQANAASTVDRYVAEWQDRLENETARKIGDLLVYNAAVIFGRWIVSRENRDDTPDDISDFECAVELLQRVVRFSDLFGDAESWNGIAARRYAVDRLARPLGMVSEGGKDGDGGDDVGVAVDVLKSAMSELIARSWRNIIGIFLDLPVHEPPPLSSSQMWHAAIDRTRLSRALARAVAWEGLVRVDSGSIGAARTTVAGRDTMWILTEEDPDRSGAGQKHERRASRIDWVDVIDVVAALERADALPIDEWNASDLVCPAPRCAVRLPERSRTAERSPHEIAVVQQRNDAGEGDLESLLIIGELPGGWGVWLVPTSLAWRAAGAQALELERDPGALPVGVRLYQFDSKPHLVCTQCLEPLVAVYGDEVQLFRLRQASEGPGVEADVVSIAGLSGNRISKIYSVSTAHGQVETHVLIIGENELYLYGPSEISEMSKQWWRAEELICVAHGIMADGVSVFGVLDDLIVFQLTDGCWAFLPALTLCETESPVLREMRAAAMGLVLRPNGDQLDGHMSLAPWIRPGQLSDISACDDGTIAVTFRDSAWTEIYLRGDGPLPVHVHSIDGRYESRGASVSHLHLDDGRHLILKVIDDRIAYRTVSLGTTECRSARTRASD